MCTVVQSKTGLYSQLNNLELEYDVIRFRIIVAMMTLTSVG